MLSQQLLEKLEHLYQESGLKVSQQEFWKIVKRESEQYDIMYSISNEQGQAVFITRVMEKLLASQKTLLTREEEKELLLEAAMGNIEARNILVERNMGLVKNRALKLMGIGFPLSDLIQEGTIGLMRAIENFDVSCCVRLSTYAVSYIDGEMKRLTYKQKRNVKLSIQLSSKLTMLKKLEEERGRLLTLEEIEKELKVGKESARLLAIHQSDSISLNAMIAEDQDTEFGSFVSSPESVETQVFEDSMKAEVYSLLEYLNDKEQQILTMLYGLYGVERISAPKIAQQLGVKSQRVYQIEARALEKLRCTKQILGMAEYMDNPEQARENILDFRDRKSHLKQHENNRSNRPKEYIKR